jgi:hypothetical protein
MVVGGWVEDGEISVSQPCSPEVGDGEGTCVEGNGVKGGGFGLSPLKVHVVSYQHIPNVFGDLLLVPLINEHHGVMFRILPVIEHPLISRMICLVFIAGDGNVGGGRGGRRDALEERRRLILHLNCICEVWLDEVSEC